MITKKELDSLKAAALAALEEVPEALFARNAGVRIKAEKSELKIADCSRWDNPGGSPSPLFKTAEFFAAASPKMVLSLVEEIHRLAKGNHYTEQELRMAEARAEAMWLTLGNAESFAREARAKSKLWREALEKIDELKDRIKELEKHEG